MNAIRFLPRVAAGAYRPQAGSVLISIHDISEPPLQPQPGWAAVHYQRFHDTDGGQAGLELFSAEQARAILAFAAEHAQAPELVVHCQMGQSRSAAVALYLAERYGVPCFKEHTLVTWQNWKVYNRFVYRRLLTVDNALED